MLARVALGLVLLTTACASARPPQASDADRFRIIKVTNHYPSTVVLYPSFSGTTIWQPIDRIPARSVWKVQIPAEYFGRDFQIVVCASSGALREDICARIDGYLNQLSVPEVVVFPTPGLYGEISSTSA